MRRWNEKTRLMLTLELAVVLPAAALVFLSAWQLKSIQRDRSIQAAFQRDFTHMLKISEKQMNQRAYELADDVRGQFAEDETPCDETLDHILASSPYVESVFFYSPKIGFLFRSQPSLLRDAQFRDEANQFYDSAKTWLPAEYKSDMSMFEDMEKSGTPYHFFENYEKRGGKRVYDSAAIFLSKKQINGETAMAGFVFDSDYLEGQFFPQMLDSAISHHEETGEKNPVVMMLHTKSDYTPMVASSGWDGGEPEVERNLEGAFPDLVLAIKMRGTTLAAIENGIVKTSFLALAAITLLLIAGLVFTHRSVSKEIALARLKSDFVSNVSHELRTPLSLIRLYSETLEMGRLKDPGKQQEYYEIIRKESERLSALINNILDFSRIEAGRKEYDFRETDLRELVRTTLDSYRYQIEQSGFTFVEKIAGDVPPMHVDREAISRSLLNLVNNALKYSQDNKYLAVSLFREDGSVKLQVTDHGMGVPHDEQEKIFEKFYRVGDPLVHNTRGSGLGLSLVRHIAQAHGGTVAVDSTLGEGSTFTLTLPIKEIQGSVQPAAANA
jgi:signal transduction histidine kinase